MKTTAKVLAVKDNLAKIKIASQINPLKVDDVISVRRGSQRSIPQNRFYWLYLNFLIEEAGLKEQGHFSAIGLHEDLKKYFLSERKLDKGMFKVIETESTTELSKSEFSEYMDMIDKFVVDFFHVDTSSFFEVYRDQYSMQ